MDIENYKFVTELHAHTKPASHCGQVSAEDTVKRYAELGYNSVVFSNHFGVYMPFADDKEKAISSFLKDYDTGVNCGIKYGINVIFGCELRFSENINDYLLFGIDRDFLSEAYDCIDMGIEKFSKYFRNENRVLIQAHPFRNGMERVNPNLLDGIETYNFQPANNSKIGLAVKYACENNCIVTAGSDSHEPNYEGLVKLLTKTELKDSFDVARVLRSRDYLFGIGDNIIFPYGIQKQC